jgi:hypothetical protein
MNLESIKNHGYRLGLEAELASQQRHLEQYIKDEKFGQALQACKNVGELLSELTFITQPQVVSKEEYKKL